MTAISIFVVRDGHGLLHIDMADDMIDRLHDLRQAFPGRRMRIEASMGPFERSVAERTEARAKELLREHRVPGTAPREWYKGLKLCEARAALFKARDEIVSSPQQPSQQSQPQPSRQQCGHEPLPFFVTDGFRPRADNIEPEWTLDIDAWLRS